MFTRILVPLDGSSFAEQALPRALALGAMSGASLHLVTVFDQSSLPGEDRWSLETRAWLTGYLEEVSERARRAGAAVTATLRSGDVAETLLREVDEVGANLVVMTTHGRGALARAWLGSVADTLSRRATTPLFLVRPREEADGDATPSPHPRTILVPLDGSELSECALEQAIQVGQLFGSAYHLTRTVHYPIDRYWPDVPFTTQVNREILLGAKKAAAEYLEQHAVRMRWRGLHVTTSVAVDAQPGHGILAEADAVGCDVIAMSTHARTGLARFVLGSAADKVLRGARVPLMLFRPAHAPAEALEHYAI